MEWTPILNGKRRVNLFCERMKENKGEWKCISPPLPFSALVYLGLEQCFGLRDMEPNRQSCWINEEWFSTLIQNVCNSSSIHKGTDLKTSKKKSFKFTLKIVKWMETCFIMMWNKNSPCFAIISNPKSNLEIYYHFITKYISLKE